MSLKMRCRIEISMEPWVNVATPHRSPTHSFLPDPRHLYSSRRGPTLRRRLTMAAAAKSGILGVSEELNSIKSLNMDQASARRRVRQAFLEVQQSLDHILFKVNPPGIVMEEMYERNSRGMEIFSKRWLPRPQVPIKGILCFCHGYGDTCTFFFEGVAKHIAASGYGVYAMDYPGFGLSEGLHGYISSFDELVDDAMEHYNTIMTKQETKGLPRFLLGQSMGGAVALQIHLKQPSNWDGVVLVAPMCKIAEDVTPPKLVLTLLNILSKVSPQAKLFPQKDIAELAFRVIEKRKMASYNVIAYTDTMRLKTAVELLKTTRSIESQLAKVTAPILILHGEADKVTDPSVSEFLYQRASSSDKNLKLYDGGYHSILEGESDERIIEVINDIITWLDSHSSGL